MEFKNIDELLEKPETITEVPERRFPPRVEPARKVISIGASVLEKKTADLFGLSLRSIRQSKPYPVGGVRTLYLEIETGDGLEMSKLRELEEYIPGYSLRSIDARQYEDDIPEYTLFFHEDSE